MIAWIVLSSTPLSREVQSPAHAESRAIHAIWAVNDPEYKSAPLPPATQYIPELPAGVIVKNGRVIEIMFAVRGNLDTFTYAQAT